MLSSRILLPLAAVAVLLGFASAPASAEMAGYNEPAYTKTNANNVYWYAWKAEDGFNYQGQTDYRYYHCLRTERNGIAVETSNGTNGPGTTNCTGTLRYGANPNSGTSSYVPFTPGTVLDDGARYTLCASDWFLYYAAWSHRNTVCPSTIIDRNKPVVTASVNGTAEVTNDPNLQLRIDYQDATSPPWFSSTQGQASNWTCVTMGQPCTPGGQPDTNCSWRHYANSKSDYFTCDASVAGQPDGKWYFCARSADAAVPDNPTGSNQYWVTAVNPNMAESSPIGPVTG